MTLWGVRGWTFQFRNVVSTAFSINSLAAPRLPSRIVPSEQIMHGVAEKSNLFSDFEQVSDNADPAR